MVREQGQIVPLLQLLPMQDSSIPGQTDFVSLPHFAALMFSMQAAFPGNFLPMEKLE